ncbi:hypothetical protein [Microbacterium sp. 1.5R]|uniref:hypothetical protein n=1 Tax=Microbacterium sp. 1.5R TaxID=1916917 RepID=UPI0011A91308|nr:hypothetical protein [Microbacterium sp. 1.5R]
MTDTDAELRALQSRAYGRDADIARDPEAMRRLADLETPAQPTPSSPASATAPAPAPLPPPTAHGATGATGVPASPTTAAPTGSPDRPEGSGAAPGSARRQGLFGQPPRSAWIIASCAAVAIAAAASASVAASVTAAARPAEPGVVDTIGVDQDGVWWDSLGEQTAGSVLFEDYFGVTFVRNEGWTEIDDQRCLMALSTKMLDSAGGSIMGLGMGCSAGAFPASLQFTVASGSPDSLRDRYPDGTSLKFTLRGDTVEVRADRTPAAE